MFTSEGQIERNVDRGVSVVLSVEDEAKPKGKTLHYWLTYMPTLSSSYGLWVMNKIVDTRSQNELPL